MFFLALFAILGMTASYAQSVSFNVKAGAGIANMNSDADSDPLFSYKVGIGAEIGLGGNWALQPTLFFVRKGTTSSVGENIEGTLFTLKSTINANYLELPIMAAYRISLPSTNVVLNAGPYLAYGLNGKYKFEAGEEEMKTNASISNKKIEWGIKRNDNHEQPDLGSENRKVLEGNNGIALGNRESKTIYLTFDEGYEAGYTSQILKTLKENNVKATFFLTAHYINTQEELVRQMIDEGHIIGNHTVNHKSMPSLTEEEIKKEVMDLHQSVYEKFGYEMKYIK